MVLTYLQAVQGEQSLSNISVKKNSYNADRGPDNIIIF